MRKLFSWLYIMVFAFFTAQAFATPWQDSPEVEKIFVNSGLIGTFVVYDVSANKLIGYNHTRAQTRYVPASTFKIANSLIALSTGAVKNTDEIFPYDGSTYPIKAWERDMNLTEAITVSNVPIYQKIARRIGLDQMQQSIQTLSYGNMKLGEQVDTFWLEGPLKISAIEQTRFLAALAQGTLPIDEVAQKAVQQLTLIDQTKSAEPQWELHAKTGWYIRGTGTTSEKEIGWWVGWVKHEGKIYAFALNLNDAFDINNLDLRVSLGKNCLRALGLHP